MSVPGMVIVGAGQAGGRAALALRQQGWTGPVTLIGAEPHVPYERPPLSKHFLGGRVTAAEIGFADRATLRAAGIEFRQGTRVERIERASHEIVLDNGEPLGYRQLLLATGRRPRTLAAPGADLAGVVCLRDLDDARALAARLVPGARLVVVGGGFIGLEVAATASAMGADVVVVEVGPRLLMRAVPEAIAEVLAARHRQAGVECRLMAQVAGFHGQAHVREVELADGTRLPADAVVIGIGAVPRDELARAAGLACDHGVVVDGTLASGDPDIFAAGDVCAFPHPFVDGRLLRLEAWQNANDQGAHAACNMLGAGEIYAPVPWFWSDQYELSLQIAGYPDLGVETVARDVGEDARLLFHIDVNQRLVGVSGVGSSAVGRDVRIGQKLIERGARVSAATLADPATKLKGLLKQTQRV